LQVDVKPNVGAGAATTAGDKKRARNGDGGGGRASRAAAREKAMQYISRTNEASDSDYDDEDQECEEDLEEMEMNMDAPRDHTFIKKIRELLLTYTPCLEVGEPCHDTHTHQCLPPERRPGH